MFSIFLSDLSIHVFIHFFKSTTTEKKRRTWTGGRTEVEEEERSCVGGHDLSSVKPLEAPTSPVINGPMTSSRSMGIKRLKRGLGRTTEKGELLESTLDKLPEPSCVWVFIFLDCSAFLKDSTWQFYPTAGFKQPAGRIVLLCHFMLLLFFVFKFTAKNIYKKKTKTLFLNELLLRKRNSHDFLHTL